MQLHLSAFKHFTKIAPNGLSGLLRLVIAISVLLSFGCLTVSGMKRLNKFDSTSKAYGKAVRWIDFETAYQFIKTERAGEKAPDFKSLNHIKVTSYDVRQTVTSADQAQVRQIVDIKYYKLDDMIERKIRDNQLWKYDTDAQTWHLVSGLPDFR